MRQKLVFGKVDSYGVAMKLLDAIEECLDRMPVHDNHKRGECVVCDVRHHFESALEASNDTDQ